MVPDEKINEFVEKIRAAAGREPRERDPCTGRWLREIIIQRFRT